MSWFPWVKSDIIRPSFTCTHCGEPMREEGNKVIVCSCAESISGEQEERQRRINFNRDREAALGRKGHKVRHGS